MNADPRRLRIVFYANCLGKGGAHHSMLTWLDLLRANTPHEIVLLCHGESWFTEQLLKRGLSYEILPMPEALAKIRHGQWKSRLQTLVKAMTAIPRLARAWIRVMFMRCDVVVLTGGRDFIMLMPLAFRKRSCTATVPQTTDWAEIPTCKLMCRVAARTFAISREVGASIEAMGVPRNRIDILPMIFTRDFGRETPAPPGLRTSLACGHGPVLVMAGVVRPHKGQLDAVKVLKDVRRSEPDATLVIVGAAPADAADAVAYEASVRAFVMAEGLAEHVRFLGWRDDIPLIYRACDFLLVPSHDYEGVPRVILEGLEAALPVFGSDLPQFRDVLLDRGTGTLRPVDQPEVWASDLVNLWRNKIRLREAKAVARKVWETHYSTEAAKNKLIPALEALGT